MPIISTYSWYDAQLIAKYLRNFSGSVLDVGCGNTRLKQYLPANSAYTGIDFNPAATVQMDISQTRYPFADNQFDHVICNAVLEHVKDDNFVLNEIYRVLKPGGTAYISIPFLQPYHADPDDYRRYTEVGLGQVLQQHGFELIEPFETYGTMITLEYLTIVEVGQWLRDRHGWWNPLRWPYRCAMLLIYLITKLCNLVYYRWQQRDRFASPGAKYLCRKPTAQNS